MLIGFRGSGKTTLGNAYQASNLDCVFLTKENTIFSEQRRHENPWMVINEIVREHQHKIIIFDRFCRDEDDLYLLNHILQKNGRKLDAIVKIDVTESIAQLRTFSREKECMEELCIGRKAKPIKFKVEQLTFDKIRYGFFSDIYREIDGSLSADDVLKIFSELLRKMRIEKKNIVNLLLRSTNH